MKQPTHVTGAKARQPGGAAAVQHNMGDNASLFWHSKELKWEDGSTLEALGAVPLCVLAAA